MQMPPVAMWLWRRRWETIFPTLDQRPDAVKPILRRPKPICRLEVKARSTKPSHRTEPWPPVRPISKLARTDFNSIRITGNNSNSQLPLAEWPLQRLSKDLRMPISLFAAAQLLSSNQRNLTVKTLIHITWHDFTTDVTLPSFGKIMWKKIKLFINQKRCLTHSKHLKRIQIKKLWIINETLFVSFL